MHLAAAVLKAATIVVITSGMIGGWAVGIGGQIPAFAGIVFMPVQATLIVDLSILTIPITILILAILSASAVQLQSFTFHRAESPSVIGRRNEIIAGVIDGAATGDTEEQQGKQQ